MRTANLSKFGLKKKTWGTLFIVTSISMNVFGLTMLTNNFIQTHDFRTPVQIKVTWQNPVPEKKVKLIKPISFGFKKAYAAEEDSRKVYMASDAYLKSNDTWKAFVQAAYKLAPIYDYPVNVLLSQAALESAHGTSHFAITRNNFFGYNCNDGSEEQDCFYFATPEESIIEYMRLIKRYPIYADAYAARTNPDEMIAYIKQAGYATDPNYVTKVMSMKEWSL